MRRLRYSLLAALACLLPLSANAAEPGLTPNSIKIGIFGPLSGPASSFGKAELGIKAIYKDLNAHGGIDGRKIDVVMQDTGCNPTKAIAAVKELVSQAKVFMLQGGSCSDDVMALKPIIAKSGIPYMVGTAAATTISKPVAANIFQNVPTTETMARDMIDFAMTRPGKPRIALISQTDEWGKSGHDPAVKELETKFHIKPVADVTLNRGSIDATAQVLKLRAAHPSFIITFLYPAPFAIFLRDAYKYGLTTPVIGSLAISIENTARAVRNPAIMKHVYVFYPLAAPIGSSKMAKWRAIFTKYNPGVRLETSSLLGMGGAEATISALRKAGPDLTRAGVIKALDEIHDLHTGVMSNPISFSSTQHAGATGGAMITYVGKKLVVIRKYGEAPH